MSRNAAGRKPLKWRWLDKLASEEGPDDPTMRHVLDSLRRRMNRDGGSCYPSVPTIATWTGLGEKTVRRKLAAADGVWIFRAHRGRGYQYLPILEPLPQPVDSDVENSPVEDGLRSQRPELQFAIPVRVTGKIADSGHADRKPRSQRPPIPKSWMKSLYARPPAPAGSRPAAGARADVLRGEGESEQLDLGYAGSSLRVEEGGAEKPSLMELFRQRVDEEEAVRG